MSSEYLLNHNSERSENFPSSSHWFIWFIIKFWASYLEYSNSYFSAAVSCNFSNIRFHHPKIWLFLFCLCTMKMAPRSPSPYFSFRWNSKINQLRVLESPQTNLHNSASVALVRLVFGMQGLNERGPLHAKYLAKSQYVTSYSRNSLF
jgi:hypothetical protein